MNFLAVVFSWIMDAMAYMMDISAYSAHAVWVTIVKASIGLIEAVDEWFPDLDIQDNAILRALVMGAVGFLIGVILMIFVSFITGNWGIPCLFFLAIGFCMFLGLIANPEGDWSLGNFPTFGRGGNPKFPVNL